jgi:hypothetical protein
MKSFLGVKVEMRLVSGQMANGGIQRNGGLSLQLIERANLEGSAWS